VQLLSRELGVPIFKLEQWCQKQVWLWGILPSYAFVGEPKTNSVIERFF
jgi:hypothetical protein